MLNTTTYCQCTPILALIISNVTRADILEVATSIPHWITILSDFNKVVFSLVLNITVDKNGKTDCEVYAWIVPNTAWPSEATVLI